MEGASGASRDALDPRRVVLMSDLEESAPRSTSDDERTTRIVRRGADWASIVEAAQCEVGDDETWARSVARAASEIFVTAHEPSVRLERLPSVDPSACLTRVMCGAGVVVDAAIRDAVGLFAYPEPGVVVSLFAPHDREIRLSRAERRLLAHVALHLETSCRLRRRPDAIRAIVDGDGALLEHAGSSRFQLWDALVSGHLGIVERGSVVRRRYVLVENAASSRASRALTPAEAVVVNLAARGQTTKLIGYALDVSPSVASTRLANAAAKIGASSRAELLRLAAALTHDASTATEEIELTDAEREIVELLHCGFTNEGIATIRGRSIHTVANQIATLLRKTNSASRRELVVRARPRR